MNPLEPMPQLSTTLHADNKQRESFTMKRVKASPYCPDGIADHKPAHASSYSVAITHFANDAAEGLYASAAGRIGYSKEILQQAITAAHTSSTSAASPGYPDLAIFLVLRASLFPRHIMSN